jgi:hypothetical protein
MTVRRTKHPITGNFEDAIWLEDYFGRTRIGIKFQSGEIFRADDHDWQFLSEGIPINFTIARTSSKIIVQYKSDLPQE